MTAIGANQLVLRLLGSGFSPLVNGKLCALRYPAARTSAPVVFPVQYAPAGVEILVVAGNPDGKRWWRHFRDGSHADVTVPAVAGALTVDASAAVVLPVLLAAGAVEGAMLGAGQALVLRRAIPALNARRWVTATAAAASFAYLVGLTPSTWADQLSSRPPLLLWPVATILGLALLGSIGFAQWLVLRHHISRSARWIATTAGAWLLGLAVFLGVTVPLWQPGQSLPTTIAIGVLGGLLMAATTSAVTALAVRHLPGLR